MVNPDRARSRTFVVTGAASGIGLATARRLLAEGGTVVGADLATPPDLGPRFQFVTADVTDEAAIAAVLAAVPDRLDGVLHAAGVAGGGPVHLLDRTEWDRVIGINLTGTFLVAKAALARMIEQPRVDGERGSLVTVASVEGLEGTAGGSSYNAAKGGVVLLTKNIALDYGPSGIRANAICPGFIETPMAQAVFGLP
ncbi:MAG: SDR family NAD(P)-dependent oxidoreductase, partial [Mycobacterium sp.]